MFSSTCSHPHEDHAGGIKEMIETDPNLDKFESIHFIDSGYPKTDSLFTRFTERHPQYPKSKVSRISAQNNDAFSNISKKGDSVYMSNFRYIPKEGASVHGHSIIVSITLQKGGKVVRIVDFDDADNELVHRWVAKALKDPANWKPDIVIAPHHGSDGNDISVLLDPRIRPSSWVITANKNNQYFHPGPKNLSKFVTASRKENVYITGADGNVYITENGLPPKTDPGASRRIVDEIIQPQIDRIEKKIAKLESAANLSGSSPSDQQELTTLKQERIDFYEAKGQFVGVRKAEPVLAVAAGPNPGNGLGGTPGGPNPPGAGGGGAGGGVPPKPSPIGGNGTGGATPKTSPMGGATVEGTADNAEIRNFKTFVRDWVVTANPQGKIFVHESISGNALVNLLYTVEKTPSGRWRVYKSGEYVGEIERPRNVSVGSCVCQ